MLCVVCVQYVSLALAGPAASSDTCCSMIAMCACGVLKAPTRLAMPLMSALSAPFPKPPASLEQPATRTAVSMRACEAHSMLCMLAREALQQPVGKGHVCCVRRLEQPPYCEATRQTSDHGVTIHMCELMCFALIAVCPGGGGSGPDCDQCPQNMVLMSNGICKWLWGGWLAPACLLLLFVEACGRVVLDDEVVAADAV